jgi:hypothetical protein
MRKFLFLFLTLVSINSHADSIKCFSGAREVYHHDITNLKYTGEIFIFQESDSEKVVIYSGDCLVKINV